MPFPIDFSRVSAIDAERILSTVRQWSANIPPGDFPALPAYALDLFNFSTTNEAQLSADLQARLRACACNVFATAMDAIQKRRCPTSDEFSAVIRLHSGTALAYQNSKNTKAAESFLQAAADYIGQAGESFALEHPQVVLEYYSAELDYFDKQQDLEQTFAVANKIVGAKVLGHEKLAGKRLIVSRLWFNKGVRCYKNGELDKAERWVHASLSCPSPPEVSEDGAENSARLSRSFRLLTVIAQKQTRSEAAIEYARMGADKDPTSVDSMILLVETLAAEKRPEARGAFLNLLASPAVSFDQTFHALNALARADLKNESHIAAAIDRFPQQLLLMVEHLQALLDKGLEVEAKRVVDESTQFICKYAIRGHFVTRCCAETRLELHLSVRFGQCNRRGGVDCGLELCRPSGTRRRLDQSRVMVWHISGRRQTIEWRS
jgi:hypothetical protein